MATTGGPIDILLAEDNPGDVRLVREALRDWGTPHRLRVVGDGRAALAALCAPGADALPAPSLVLLDLNRVEPVVLRADDERLPAPSLVLLDLNLPRLDGRAVLRAIRADPALRRLPVVVLSGAAEPGDVAAAYDLGANAYVTKPPDLDAFLAAARTIVAFWGEVATLPTAGAGSVTGAPPRPPGG